MQWLLIPKLKMANCFSVRYFTDRFPGVLRQHDTENLDVLEGQFRNYQLDDNDESKFDRIDLFWSHTLSQRDENGQMKHHLP